MPPVRNTTASTGVTPIPVPVAAPDASTPATPTPVATPTATPSSSFVQGQGWTRWIGASQPWNRSTVTLVASGPNGAVHVLSNGKFSPTGRAPSPAEEAQALYAAAEAADQSPVNLFAEAGLSAPARVAARKNLEALIAASWETGDLAVRTASATMLVELLEVTEDPTERDALLDAYADLATNETDAQARQAMSFYLSNSSAVSDPEVKALADELIKEISPVSPPYEQWFKDGNTTVDISWTVGGNEFWPYTDAQLQKNGFTVEGEVNRNGVTIYTKTVDQPGVGPTTFRIAVRNGGTDVFAPMKDDGVEIVGYDGHSDFGRNMMRSIGRAPEATNGGDGKLIFYGLCVGKFNLDSVLDQYPNAQVMTTNSNSYFRSNSGENFDVLMELLDGVSKREPWETIHSEMERVSSKWLFRSWQNYMTPVLVEDRERAIDRDDDGQADIHDTHFNVAPVVIPVRTEDELTPSPVSGTNIEGTNINLAAQQLNRVATYNSKMHQTNRDSRVIAAGYFIPEEGNTDIVRFTEVERADGSVEYQMQVSSSYAHLSDETLRAISVYEYSQFLYETGRVELTPLEQNLNTLLAVAGSLNMDMGNRDFEVWEALLSHYGLPEVSLLTVRSTLGSHDYAGSSSDIKKLQGKLPPELIEALGG